MLPQLTFFRQILFLLNHHSLDVLENLSFLVCNVCLQSTLHTVKLKIFVKEAGLFVLQIPKQIDPFFKMFFLHLGNKKQDGSAFYLVMRYDNITVAVWRIFN